jgi:hypothetical protein
MTATLSRLDLIPPETVACAPYHTRLTEAACAARWRRAQGRGHPLSCSHCANCSAGHARAGGDALVLRHGYVPVEGAPTRRSPSSGQVEILVRCSCGRSPDRWYPPSAIGRKKVGCQRCSWDANTPVAYGRGLVAT